MEYGFCKKYKTKIKTKQSNKITKQLLSTYQKRMEKNNSWNSHSKLLGTGKVSAVFLSPFCSFSHAVIWRKETPIILFFSLSSPGVAMVTNYLSRLAFLCTQSLCFAKKELRSPIYSIPPHPPYLLLPASFRTVPFENS